MHGQSFDKKSRNQTSRNFIDVILRILGFGHAGSLIGIIAWIFATIIKVSSIGAKIITRRKLGTRAAGRISILGHAILIFLIVWIYPQILDTKRDATLIDKQSGIYLIAYFILISFLWIKNWTDSKNRKGIEQYSYFRGHGFFTSTENPNSKKNRWLRLIDPFIFAFITWVSLHFLGDYFYSITLFFYLSSFALFIEECLFIYDEYSLDLNIRDAEILATDASQTNESTNSGY